MEKHIEAAVKILLLFEDIGILGLCYFLLQISVCAISYAFSNYACTSPKHFNFILPMWVSSSLAQGCSEDPVICCKHLLSWIILVFLESQQSSPQAYLAVSLYVHSLNLLRMKGIDIVKYDSDKTNGLQSRKILIIIIIMRKIASHKVFVAWRCCIFWTFEYFDMR